MQSVSPGALLVLVVASAAAYELVAGLRHAWRAPARREALLLWRDGTAIPLTIGLVLQAPLGWLLLKS